MRVNTNTRVVKEIRSEQLAGSNRESHAPEVAPLFDPVPQRALRQSVVVSLLNAVFRAQLRAGDWLNAKKLAEQLGVSATPVREALVELGTIGIVETQHNRGTMVRSFGLVELRDIYHLRRVLEAEAARCACGKVPSQSLEEVRQEMIELQNNKKAADWSERAMACDCRLHEMIALHCGSQRLAEEISRYNTLVQCIREVVGNQSYAQQRALPEHLEIIQALLASDPERAASAMTKHIRSSAQVVEEALFPASVAEQPNSGKPDSPK